MLLLARYLAPPRTCQAVPGASFLAIKATVPGYLPHIALLTGGVSFWSTRRYLVDQKKTHPINKAHYLIDRKGFLPVDKVH